MQQRTWTSGVRLFSLMNPAFRLYLLQAGTAGDELGNDIMLTISIHLIGQAGSAKPCMGGCGMVELGNS